MKRIILNDLTPEMQVQMRAAKGLFQAFERLRMAIIRADWRRKQP